MYIETARAGSVTDNGTESELSKAVSIPGESVAFHFTIICLFYCLLLVKYSRQGSLALGAKQSKRRKTESQTIEKAMRNH